MSIQWRLVTMFVLLVVAVMLMFGTFLQFQVIDFYHSSFKQEMSEVFLDELKNALTEAAKPQDEERCVAALRETMNAYSGRLGINTYRNYYILAKSDGSFLAGSDEVGGARLTFTNNLIAARAGRVGDETSYTEDYLDFALPIEGGSEGGYIVYVRDSKNEMLQIVRTILVQIAQTLVIGILFSAFLGFLLSKSITKPLTTHMRKAEGLARGDFESRIEVRTNDEIGSLARTFNNMAGIISRSMKEISQEKHKTESILLYMTDGVIAFDTEQRIIHINPAARDLLHIVDEATVLFDDLFSELKADISLSELIYLEQLSITERQLEVEDKILKAFFAAFKMEGSKIAGVVVVLHDVTQSQRLDESRREFVANVSHELRTPLTTIKSYTETMLEDVADPMAQQFLPVIMREVDRMTRIVKDLLTLSSLDGDRSSERKGHFSLDGLLRDCVTRLALEAKSKNQQLTYSPATKLPEIFADRDRIEQVLINIITNSIKYTGENGVIEVFAGHLYNGVYVRVLDNGIGIPEKDIPHIFERFYRVDKARTREQGGTGLGLAIAREILRQHGGSIKINSEYGTGTEVIVMLPIVSK